MFQLFQKEEIEELISAVDVHNPQFIPALEELTTIYRDCLKYFPHDKSA